MVQAVQEVSMAKTLNFNRIFARIEEKNFKGNVA